jgi:hypothetical protein
MPVDTIVCETKQTFNRRDEMTMEEISEAQQIANVRYQAALMIRQFLDKAEAEYAEKGGDDWETELEAIRELVFDE